MTAKFHVFTGVTLSALLICSIASVQAASLVVDNETVPLSAMDAFAKSTIMRADYCPPASDKFVIDTFVRRLLLARNSEAEEKAYHYEKLQQALQPHIEKLDKIKHSLSRQRENEGIARVYNKQISRITSEIEAIEDKREKDWRARTRFHVSSHNKLKQLDTASDADKQFVANMTGFVNLYTQRVRSEITDDVVQQYYEQLVQQKDERLVDVYLFKTRSLYLTFTDSATINRAADFLRQNAGNANNSGLLMTGIPGVLVTPDTGTRWSRLDSLDAAKKNPEALNPGSTIVEEANHPSFAKIGQVHQLFYIYDKKYYPVVPIDTEDSRYHHSSSRNLRQEVYSNRMESIYSVLRSQSVVTMDGATVTEANDYPECPRR